MPTALDRKYPNAPTDWRWQWVFPQERRWKNTKSGEQGRNQIHAAILQRAMKEAVRKAGLSNTRDVTPSGIHLPPTCWRRTTTSEPSRNSWGTRT